MAGAFRAQLTHCCGALIHLLIPSRSCEPAGRHLAARGLVFACPPAAKRGTAPISGFHVVENYFSVHQQQCVVSSLIISHEIAIGWIFLWEISSMIQPIADNGPTIGCQYALWVKLYSTHIKIGMPDSHNAIVLAHGCNF